MPLEAPVTRAVPFERELLMLFSLVKIVLTELGCCGLPLSLQLHRSPRGWPPLSVRATSLARKGWRLLPGLLDPVQPDGDVRARLLVSRQAVQRITTRAHQGYPRSRRTIEDHAVPLHGHRPSLLRPARPCRRARPVAGDPNHHISLHDLAGSMRGDLVERPTPGPAELGDGNRGKGHRMRGRHTGFDARTGTAGAEHHQGGGDQRFDESTRCHGYSSFSGAVVKRCPLLQGLRARRTFTSGTTDMPGPSTWAGSGPSSMRIFTGTRWTTLT